MMSKSAQIAVLTLAAVLLPLGWIYMPTPPAPEREATPFKRVSTFAEGGPLEFRRERVTAAPEIPPQITNVNVVDLDQDGRAEILVCDALGSRVVSYHRGGSGQWQERVLAEHVIAPAHAEPADLDGDGDLDVVVAMLGDLNPNDSPVGRVVWLENLGSDAEPPFQRRYLLSNVRRVADVRPGDLDGDGDLDLAVAVFGYSRGEVLWLENQGEGKFVDHIVDPLAPGVIHVPLADYDQDGDLDIATVSSQDDEEIWGYENVGGRFQKRLLHSTVNFDLGSAGLIAADLDSDGDTDLVWPVGDNLEYSFAYPQPYHGCFWLENQGDWIFEARRIAHFGGTYAADVADLDGDSDQDVVLVSMSNDWTSEQASSVVWLENDGRARFAARWEVAADPIQLITVCCGDVDGDGRTDVVTGALRIRPPDISLSGVDVFLSAARTTGESGL